MMIQIISLFKFHWDNYSGIIGTGFSVYGVSKAVVQMPFELYLDAIGDKLVLMMEILLMGFIYFAYTLNNQS